MFGLQAAKEENKIAKNAKLLKELTLRSQEQDAYFESLYEKHGLSKEKFIAYLADPKNFDEQTWQSMQTIRAEFTQKIQFRLNQIKDPAKAKKTYKDLQMAQKWIPVR